MWYCSEPITGTKTRFDFSGLRVVWRNPGVMPREPTVIPWAFLRLLGREMYVCMHAHHVEMRVYALLVCAEMVTKVTDF